MEDDEDEDADEEKKSVDAKRHKTSNSRGEADDDSILDAREVAADCSKEADDCCCC